MGGDTERELASTEQQLTRSLMMNINHSDDDDGMDKVSRFNRYYFGCYLVKFN